MDGWQVIPFFKGIARSGKIHSKSQKFSRSFYDNEDVGTLSNNIEKKFWPFCNQGWIHVYRPQRSRVTSL